MISFYGGKAKQSDFIYEQITPEIKENTKIYTEVFSGAMWNFFKNDFSFCDTVVYNDLNPFLYNFYYCCSIPEFRDYLLEMNEPDGLIHFEKNNEKFKYEEQYDRFKQLFQKYKKELYTDNIGKEVNIQIPDYDMAFKYAILLRHAFSSISHEKVGFSYSTTSNVVGKPCPEPKIHVLLRKLQDQNIIKKLNKISNFECLDFEKHINKWDSLETLFYVDPPYYSTEKNYYRGKDHFGEFGHYRLSNVLKNIKGKFILSYYDFDKLNEFYPRNQFTWKEKAFTKASTSVQKSGKDKRGFEVLIMNY
jgi:DNA adenine methylase